MHNPTSRIPTYTQQLKLNKELEKRKMPINISTYIAMVASMIFLIIVISFLTWISEHYPKNANRVAFYILVSIIIFSVGTSVFYWKIILLNFAIYCFFLAPIFIPIMAFLSIIIGIITLIFLVKTNASLEEINKDLEDLNNRK